jgi:hypothetical protein
MESGKRRIAAIERKNPAGITSNPAYFITPSFHAMRGRQVTGESRGTATAYKWKTSYRITGPSVKKNVELQATG